MTKQKDTPSLSKEFTKRVINRPGVVTLFGTPDKEYIITGKELNTAESGLLTHIEAAAIRSRQHTGQQGGATAQCDTCHLKGLRECIHHGYPEETIPPYCNYKIGDSHVQSVDHQDVTIGMVYAYEAGQKYERNKVLDELDVIAKKGMKEKEDGLGKKYCREHANAVDSCWHGLHRIVESFRKEMI